MNGPCTTIRQYRDRDQSIQNDADADTEAARREADSFSFGPSVESIEISAKRYEVQSKRLIEKQRKKTDEK